MFHAFAGFSSAGAGNAFIAAAQCGGSGFRATETHGGGETSCPLVFPNAAGAPPGGKSPEADQWEEVDMYGEADWYPDAVELFLRGPVRGPPPIKLTAKIRKHLACLGWRIELDRGAAAAAQSKFRYTSPTRHHRFNTLRLACRHLVLPKSNVDEVSDDDDGSDEEDDDYMEDDSDEEEFESVPIIQKIQKTPNFEPKTPNCGSVPNVGDNGEELKEITNFESVPIFRQRKKTPNFEPVPNVGDNEEELNRFVGSPRYDPESVIEWIKIGNGAGRMSQSKSEVSSRVKNHLLFIGWDLYYAVKGCPDGATREELRYRPPPPHHSRAHNSLINACNFLVNEGLVKSDDAVVLQSRPDSTSSRVVKRKIELGHNIFGIGTQAAPQQHPHVNGAFGAKVEACHVLGKIGDNSRMGEIGLGHDIFGIGTQAAQHPHVNRAFGAKVEACHVLGKNGDNSRMGDIGLGHDIFGIGTQAAQQHPHVNVTFGANVNSRMWKRNQEAELSGMRLRNGNVGEVGVLEGKRRKVQVVGARNNARTMTGLLIDSNLVEDMAEVYYRSRKGDVKLKEGWVTREGIKCRCCQNMFALSKFEAHAGSTNHRPAANIILPDGRSLSELHNEFKGL